MVRDQAPSREVLNDVRLSSVPIYSPSSGK